MPTAAVWAQAGPGEKAPVFTVTQGQPASFRMPRVRLPDAAVARRINRPRRRWVPSYFRTPDPAASPRR